MQAAASPGSWSGTIQPNDLDRKRIERALRKRRRYRYVSPAVFPAVAGYWIRSACCSRTVDAEGGVIDIAMIEFDGSTWRLLRKDHAVGRWEQDSEYDRLVALLDHLNEDPQRKFWQ